MKKRLNEQVLKRGDVILTTSDATGDGVHSANTQRCIRSSP